MKADEFKLRLRLKANNLVDQYFTRETILERFLNATLKLIIKNNVNKIDAIVNLLSDANGEIDASYVIDEYVNQLGEDRISINLRDYVNDETIKNMLPDRTLTITKEDLFEILNSVCNYE